MTDAYDVAKAAGIRMMRAALTRDPADTNARAALGRLQFKEPDQPFFRSVEPKRDRSGCEVMIQIRNPCNYRCSYCVAAGSNNVPVQRMNLEAIDAAYRSITGRITVTQFECGGGEPTVHPEFPELLRIAASYGPVSFPTNNSQKPERWLPKETARRIDIRSSLHPESEENLDRYVANALFLIEHGCSFECTYIARPDRIAKIAEYREFFAERGITFLPVAFIGTWEGKEYPHAFTEEQHALFSRTGEETSWYHQIQPHVNRIRNFRGVPCIAGQRSVYIMHDGTLRRCTYDMDRVLTTPLDKPEPCGVKDCGCGMLLERLNTLDDFHREGPPSEKLVRGVSIMDAEARAAGYRNATEAHATEHPCMYDALMAAYGKDEFPEP